MFAFGLWMFALNPGLVKQPWMHAKLGFIALLFAYHFKNHALYLRTRRNEVPWSSFGLRLWNEGATVVLIAVIFLAVVKRLDWQYGAIGLLVLVLVLVLAANAYRKRRTDHAESGGPGTGAGAR
jgi:putative membrane protein